MFRSVLNTYTPAAMTQPRQIGRPAYLAEQSEPLEPIDPRPRCPWAGADGPRPDRRMVAYHDLEWGTAVHDDLELFERLALESFQAGLSWSTILNKRDTFRAAFRGFDPTIVAAFGPADRARLMADPGIVRNGAKIDATIGNAHAVRALQAAFGSFDAYLDARPAGPPPACRRRLAGEIPADDRRRPTRSPATCGRAASGSSARRSCTRSCRASASSTITCRDASAIAGRADRSGAQISRRRNETTPRATRTTTVQNTTYSTNRAAAARGVERAVRDDPRARESPPALTSSRMAWGSSARSVPAPQAVEREQAAADLERLRQGVELEEAGRRSRGRRPSTTGRRATTAIAPPAIGGSRVPSSTETVSRTSRLRRQVERPQRGGRRRIPVMQGRRPRSRAGPATTA